VAILQALLALISKSGGKILNALFGWVVRALFGRISPNERALVANAGQRGEEGLVAAQEARPLKERSELQMVEGLGGAAIAGTS
jgi:hypothetical protein